MTPPSNDAMEEAADAINYLSAFLAYEQIRIASDVDRFLDGLPPPEVSEGTSTPTDVIVFCASAVLSIADTVFTALSDTTGPDGSSDPAKISLRERNLVLVLCGGVGHSTSFLYEAVAKHPRYKEIADATQGLPESRVIQKIAEQWFGLKVLDAPPQEPQSQSGLRIVVEDRSTNCGANASESRKVLETFGIHSPRSVIVVQDPTMCRRTVASFEKVYEDHASPPRFVSWPTFVPRVAVRGEPPEAADIWSSLEFVSFDSQGASLWSMSRFVDLLMGEIPRLRDDEDGYGPNGKGFIAHVDVPSVAEAAWKQLDALVEKGKEERVRS